MRVGGLVGDLLPGGFTLDDGTATGPVTLQGPAADLLPLIAPGDAINVVGRIESTDRGWTVVVADPAGVVLAGDPVAPGSTTGSDAGGSTVPAIASTRGEARSAGLGSLPGFDAGLAGLGALIAVSAASLAVTMLRRRHLKRLLSAAMATRLAAVVGGTVASDGSRLDAVRAGPAGVGSRTAKHDPRTSDPA